MIDRTKKYWTGDSPEDIGQYLRLYAEDPGLEVKPVVCHGCGGDAFEVRCDANEGVIQVKCAACGAKRVLLDGEEYWENARPRLRRCRVCKESKTFQVRAGFLRRENGDVRWVYIGERCTACGTLGSFLDWKVNYGPTDQMEKNL